MSSDSQARGSRCVLSLVFHHGLVEWVQCGIRKSESLSWLCSRDKSFIIIHFWEPVYGLYFYFPLNILSLLCLHVAMLLVEGLPSCGTCQSGRPLPSPLHTPSGDISWLETLVPLASFPGHHRANSKLRSLQLLTKRRQILTSKGPRAPGMGLLTECGVRIRHVHSIPSSLPARHKLGPPQWGRPPPVDWQHRQAPSTTQHENTSWVGANMF